ncbi:uracil-DNA glycosylase [Polaromonas sp.]|uniref:uracil-DNA glycosylase n=1 Tax=Polaromonas sp. TaxID=1869339 RepID=UPI001A1C9BCB|nr:uracil-DNA glycosylase [Burkholderiales bacterium]
MNPNTFVRQLSSISFQNVFNPYADTCAVHDKSNAPSTRRKNLRTYLGAIHAQGADTIWMGRDLGYRGGRRTGLALTDEYHLLELQRFFPGTTFTRATIGSPVAERTATEIWAALRAIPSQPLLWNVFPFHPHVPEDPLTNRRFTVRELAEVDELNASLIDWLDVKRIVSIGQDAAVYAKRFGVEVEVVRHPSYGGVADFRRGIAALYELKEPHVGCGDAQASLFPMS